MTEIAKERIGWLHQVNNFSTSFASEDKEARVGIVIQLTKNAQETDLTAVGYQKPKAPTFDSHLSKFILVKIFIAEDIRRKGRNNYQQRKSYQKPRTAFQQRDQNVDNGQSYKKFNYNKGPYDERKGGKFQRGTSRS